LADLIKQIKGTNGTTYDLQDKVSTFGGTNLFKGGYQVTTTSSGNTVVGSLSLDTNLIPLNKMPGKTFVFTYDYSIEGTKLYNNTGDFSKDRYGIHLSYTYTVSGNSTQQTAYPGASYLTASGTGRAIQVFSIPSNHIISSFGFGIQPFNKPASGNNATWYLKNVQLEIGNKPTQWTPNPNDLVTYASDTIEFFQ